MELNLDKIEYGINDNITSIDYDKFKCIENSMAITPYFGIGGEFQNSTILHYPHLANKKRITYPIYLIKCLFGLKKYFSTIVVSCQNQKDFNDLLNIRNIFNIDFEILMLKTESQFLPIDTLISIQNRQNINQYNYIYYTECDQIPFINTDLALNAIDKNTVLVPHRLVRKFINEDITPKQFVTNATAKFDNNIYFVCCLHYAISMDNNFTIHTDEGGAYGAAYLCTTDCFKDVNYIHSKSCPCEYASHSVFQSDKIMIKTKNIYDAFTVHLSGINEHLKLNNLDIIDYPNLW